MTPPADPNQPFPGVAPLPPPVMPMMQDPNAAPILPTPSLDPFQPQLPQDQVQQGQLFSPIDANVMKRLESQQNRGVTMTEAERILLTASHNAQSSKLGPEAPYA